MKLHFPTYPIDLLICMLWSILILPVVLLDINETLRIILGLPFLLFIPGYVLIFCLFPMKKTDRGIDVIERIALSFGLSIAVVPLIGLGLNYTPWGIRLEPILLSLFGFIIGISIIAFIRWRQTPPEERFIISFDLSFPTSESPLDKALTLILIATIIIAMGALVYVVVTPKQGEQFTEFYLLGQQGNASGYPQTLQPGENATVIIGVVNHEYQQINYTIEIWLVNQSLEYNETTQENETIYHHLWFKDSLKITLEHVPVTIDEAWMPQWEQNYTFSIEQNGTFKLLFLLFTEQREQYERDTEYADAAASIIDPAYRSLHLWITVEEP